MLVCVSSTDCVQLPFSLPEFTECTGAGAILRRSVLPDGLVVVTESVPGALSATAGIWVNVGSRDEDANVSGALGSTHFLEHLLFKGTSSKGAYDLAAAFDAMGADHNAMTAKEHTCYYAKVRAEDLPAALALLCEMVTDSVIDAKEFELERGVIVEELAMAADDHADFANERFFEQVLGVDDPLGRPIGGTPDSVRQASREEVWRHYRANYLPARTVVSVSGCVEHVRTVETVARYYLADGGGEAALSPWRRVSRVDAPHDTCPFVNAVLPGACSSAREDSVSDLPVSVSSAAKTPVGVPATVSEPVRRHFAREAEQLHLLFGGVGLPAGDPRRYAFTLLNTVLGSGMSSRLFQEVRERRGLAYSTYSFGASYSDTGVFGLYAATSPQHAQETFRVLAGQLEELVAAGFSVGERERALGQLAGTSALALEDTEFRMARLARAELGSGLLLGPGALVDRVSAVTDGDVCALVENLLGARLHLVTVGESWQ